ncbi:MAG: DHA2 family efflux MFS transporter permease subunit [Stellaceae bacterium]
MSEAGGHFTEVKHHGLITISIMAATMMQALDTTIANVALPYMQGTFSVAQDQVTWVLTSYIVAAAIATPLTGWLATSFGTKRVFLLSIVGFTIASALCGIAGSIYQIVFYRLVQGVCGAALVPLAQSVLLDINPPAHQGRAMAIWGVGVMLGPILGPTLGGWLTQHYSWRYVFYINVPIGILATFGLALFLHDSPQHRRSFDFFGFAMLSLGIGALQMMLDRGELKDWFGSTEILIELALAIAGFWIFLIHAATAKNSFINLRIFKDWNFSAGQILMFLIAMVLYSSTALLPTLLQELYNYPVETAGWLMTPRGIGTMLSMMIVGRLTTRYDSRLLMLVGFAIGAYGFWLPTRWTLEMGWWPIAWAGIAQGVGMGLIFVPLSLSSFGTLAGQYRNEGTAIYSLVRNIGGSIGISISEAYLANSIQANHQTLATHVSPFNSALRMPDIAAIWNLQTAAGLGALNAEVTRQATMIAYLDAFMLMTVLTVCAVPLLMLLRRIDPRRGRGGPAAAE